MNDICLLDCTLRDGGYINQWNFGYSTIINCFERLVCSGVDIIEVGFLDEHYEFDKNNTIQPTTDCYDKILFKKYKGNSMVVAMIDYGNCSIENISLCENSFIDGIRIIFKKPNMRNAVEFAHKIKEKGYDVFLQMVSITSYTDRDILDFIDMANELEPYAVSIVDTYGLMHKEKLFHYFDLLDVNLKNCISIGYHSHNNLQLAYSNAIELIKHGSSHKLLIDGTMFGMGKNAGNAPTELLAMFLNKNSGKNYDLNQLLEVIDLTITKIYRKKSWGYSLPLFIAASSDCHPNYVNYLIGRKTLSIKSVNEILKSIPVGDKLNYNPKLIEKLYLNYRKTALCDKNKDILMKKFENKDILLIGPGMSLHESHDIIADFISKNNVITISVNCFPEFKSDYFFVNSDKRYSMLSAACKLANTKLIVTSNVCEPTEKFEYVLNYDSLTDENELIYDNSLIMILKILSKSKCGKIYLAGFDGFSSNDLMNYYNEYFDFAADFDKLFKVNDLIKDRLDKLGKQLSLHFITKSYYGNEEPQK